MWKRVIFPRLLSVAWEFMLRFIFFKRQFEKNFAAIVSFVESLFIISSLIFTARKGAFSSVNSFFAFKIQICHHERNDAMCRQCIFYAREFERRKCIRIMKKLAARMHRCGTSKRITQRKRCRNKQEPENFLKDVECQRAPENHSIIVHRLQMCQFCLFIVWLAASCT